MRNEVAVTAILSAVLGVGLSLSLCACGPANTSPSSHATSNVASDRVPQLHAATPDPFDADTTIEYSVPQSTQVELKIYDLSGRHVRSLVHDHKEAGLHQVVWDGLDDSGDATAPGIYLYSLQVGSFTESGKVVKVDEGKTAGVLTSSSGATIGSPSSLDTQLQSLADQIAGSFVGNRTVRIAALAFSNIDGSTSDLGLYVAEELVTRLFLTKRFEVIERGLLDKVLQEHELNLSGVIDESSAKELGRILGIDAIVSGSITDLQTSVKINARLISAETGKLASVAAVTLPQDTIISGLMGRTSARRAEPPKGPTVGVAADPGVIYLEDFSSVEEGMIPEAWVGGGHLAVRPSATRRGVSVLTPFERGPYRFTVPEVSFPEDWKLTVDFTLARRGGGSVHMWKIGDLALRMRNTGVFFHGTQFKRPFEMGAPARFEIVKKGSVFKLFIDSAKVAVIRIEGFEPPRGMTITDHAGFTIYKILLEDLSSK